jgi:multidrug resistance efflux pump
MSSTARADKSAARSVEADPVATRNEPEFPSINTGKAKAARKLEAVPGPGAQDAPSLQALLDRHFHETDDAVIPVTAPAPAAAAPSRLRSRLVKAVLGLALIAVAGWMPLERLFQVSSVEAVVNARLVTVRSPIGGTVQIDAVNSALGETIAAGAPLVTVSDARADHSRLTAALDERAAAREERKAFAAKLKNLTDVQTDLRAQLDAFRRNRLTQIEAEMAEADAQIEAALAEQTRAEAIRARQSALVQSGSVSQAVMDDATRDAAVAIATIKGARARKASLAVERDALNSGNYLGDDYNDQPRSAQQLQEVAQQIASARADLARLDARIERAEADIAAEQRTAALASQARLAAPVGGRIWEVLTAPGEQVAAGQPLFSLLDCSQAIVTASVSEAVYNSLSVGMPATFSYREGGKPMQGKVVQLSGVAMVSSNFAILPSALTKEPYRVAITVGALDRDGSCPVGRTGRVVFGSAGS